MLGCTSCCLCIVMLIGGISWKARYKYPTTNVVSCFSDIRSMKYSRAHCVLTTNCIYCIARAWSEMSFSEYHRVESNIVRKIPVSITLLGCTQSEESLETAVYPYPTDASYEGTLRECVDNNFPLHTQLWLILLLYSVHRIWFWLLQLFLFNSP